MNIRKYFLLDWENLSIAVIAEIISIIFHNLIYGIFKIEEPFFFIIAVIIIPLYVIISIIYTSFEFLKLKKSVKEKKKLVEAHLKKESKNNKKKKLGKKKK
ncbi:MAG: hypothetical protein WC867_06730 [Candidatus Pacearchaeota archaeon]|jgi:ABC-type bacteriocin/lantibiotic exporter with double-glycine peptidase domain